MLELRDFYHNRKVLVTGHTGFKGTWISEMLCQLGAEVWGYSLPVKSGSFYSKAVPNIKRSIAGDVRDYQKLYEVIETFRPEIIIHLASHSSLLGSMKIPYSIISTNIMGVENILECARIVKSVRSVVIVTSDKVYANDGNNAIRTEESTISASDPYGTSKVCQELLTKCYRKTFSFEKDIFNVATARASNCISIGDDNNSRLFPYILDTLSEGKIPEIRHKDSIRSWQYVLDVLYGYLLLAKKLYEVEDMNSVKDAYNFGPANDGIRTVGDVVLRMCKIFGVDGYIETNVGDNIIGESTILQINSELAEKELKWVRKVDLDDAIDRIANMTIRIRNGENVKKVISREVKEYFY